MVFYSEADGITASQVGPPFTMMRFSGFKLLMSQNVEAWFSLQIREKIRALSHLGLEGWTQQSFPEI